jgi:glycosyltransferase involved in cell wall biosynthesis
MARVHPIKGADTLLEAFWTIVKAIPGAVLVVAGPDEFGLEARFRELVGHQGLTDQVLFPGMVVGDAKAWLLARADLFCLPSVAEGFSMAVLEALATGTPVLITPGCHFAEVEAAGAGRVVEKAPEAVAAAAIDMLSDAGRLMRMGQAGREFVAGRYSWGKIVDQMIDVYEEGLERHRRQLTRTS